MDPCGPRGFAVAAAQGLEGISNHGASTILAFGTKTLTGGSRSGDLWVLRHPPPPAPVPAGWVPAPQSPARPALLLKDEVRGGASMEK